MAKTLAELRKQSTSVLSKLKQQSEETTSYKDERIWTPKYDKEKGKGFAVIRFLPAPQGEEFPFVTVYSHSFKGSSGKYFIENCPSTIKKPSPVGEMNRSLWNSGIESDKDVARKYKRKTNYYANVLIVNDPINPENNGTVKLYRYGPMIHKILEGSMFPEFETDTPLNPFCPWEGANFEIRITTKKIGNDTVPNYETSIFKDRKAIGSDDEIEAIWAKCHSLAEFVSEKNFKSYEELRRKLVEVLGHTVGSGISVSGDDAEVPQEKSAPKAKSKPAEKVKEVASDDVPWDDAPAPKKETKKASQDDDLADDLSFFENL